MSDPTVTVLGEFTVGALFPTLAGFIAEINSDISGQLQGLLAMSAALAIQLPSVDLLVSAVAAVSANLALQGPGISLSVNVQADLILKLQAEIKLMGALIIAFGGSAKAEVFSVNCPANHFGVACDSEVGAGIQGGSATDNVSAIVMVTRYPAFIQDLLKVLG